MSKNPEIPRDHVHALSEACAALGMQFQPVARRTLEDQARLLRFFKANLGDMPGNSGEVSLYLLAVIVRIFQQCGGRLVKVGPHEIGEATRRLGGHAPSLFPVDADFPSRVRAIEGRAQPHILDEALNALFEREERRAEEVELDLDAAARVFLMLWAATEALDGAWTAPTPPPWAPAT